MTLPRTDPPLGGMLKHLALVETDWFDEVLRGEPVMPPFDSADWEADRDRDWHSAVEDAPAALQELLDEAVRRADRAIDGETGE